MTIVIVVRLVWFLLQFFGVAFLVLKDTVKPLIKIGSKLFLLTMTQKGSQHQFGTCIFIPEAKIGLLLQRVGGSVTSISTTVSYFCCSGNFSRHLHFTSTLSTDRPGLLST